MLGACTPFYLQCGCTSESTTTKTTSTIFLLRSAAAAAATADISSGAVTLSRCPHWTTLSLSSSSSKAAAAAVQQLVLFYCLQRLSLHDTSHTAVDFELCCCCWMLSCTKRSRSFPWTAANATHRHCLLSSAQFSPVQFEVSVLIVCCCLLSSSVSSFYLLAALSFKLPS